MTLRLHLRVNFTWRLPSPNLGSLLTSGLELEVHYRGSEEGRQEGVLPVGGLLQQGKILNTFLITRLKKEVKELGLVI